MIGKLLSTVAIKLVTEKFLVRVTLALAEHFAEKSENKLDDKIVKELRDALT